MQVDGMGESSAAMIRLVPRIWRKARMEEREVLLETAEKAGSYLVECFSLERNETVYVICLDQKAKMLSCRRVGEGSTRAAGLNVRKVVEAALLCGATSVILSHNHPSGLPMPSRDDYDATVRIGSALKAVGVILRDHIIVAGQDFVSMRESGYLDSL